MRELVTTACLEGCGWPEHVRRMAGLKLVVDGRVEETAQRGKEEVVARKVNNVLYSLANFIAGSDQVKQMELVFCGDIRTFDEGLLVRMLYPLGKLRAQQRDVAISGLSAPMEKKLLTTPAPEGRVHHTNLIAKYWEFEDRLREIHGLGRDTLTKIQFGPMGGVVEALEEMVIDEYGWVDEQWEKAFITLLMQVFNYVKGFQVRG